MTTDTQVPKQATERATPLLAAMRKGDPASCRDFMAHFEAPLYNYLYWLSGDPETAVRLFQQTMLSVYRNLGRVRKARDVNIWVFRQATRLYLDQSQRRLQEKRSSWDHILKGGLEPAMDDRWSQWDDPAGDLPDEAPDHTPAVVAALKDLGPRERAAILLAGVAGMRPRDTAACLELSRRATGRILLRAFGQLARGLPAHPAADPEGLPRGARQKIRRHLLGLLSAGRAKKLVAAMADHEAGQALQREEQALWQTIRALPHLPPPADLVDDTEAQLRAGQEAQEQRIATWGFRFMQVTVPVFILIFIAIILLPTISRSREAARRAAAADNLRTIGAALLRYSEQSAGNALPPMAPAKGLWVPDLTRLYPRYIKDPAVLVRPSLKDPDLVKAMAAALEQSPPDYATAHQLLARSYVYTGYVLQNAMDLEALVAVRNHTEQLDLDRKIETPSKDFFRLGRGVEVFFTTNYNDPGAAAKTRASLPVMFETFDSPGFGRDPDGANVLYLDGHVEYVRFGTEFPVTEPVHALMSGQR